MTSSRQIDANRRNAKLSTGPVTTEGKQRSRRSSLRHVLTAETIIDALEDAEDHAAFKMAVTADFEFGGRARTGLRLASLLWRRLRATAIESGAGAARAMTKNGHPSLRCSVKTKLRGMARPAGLRPFRRGAPRRDALRWKGKRPLCIPARRPFPFD